MRTTHILLTGLLLVLCQCSVSAEDNALVLWTHWKSDPIKIEFINHVVAEFQKTTGIAVHVVWMEKNELLEKLPFAIEGAEPDVTYIDSGFTHVRIWRALADLSDLRITAQTDPSWSLGSVGEGKNNFLPIEGASSAMYYNKRVFEQAKIVVPQDRAMTAQEFLNMIRALRAAGVTPIGEGVTDRPWKAGLPMLYAILRYAGPEKLMQLLHQEIDFSDPDVTAALTFWKQVVDAQGYDGQNALKMNMNDSIYEMTDGRAGLNFCGTWIYSKFGLTDRDKGQVGVLDWFTVENGKGNDVYELAWVAGYGINRNSKRIEAAKKFLEFLMTPTAASLWVKYVQGPYPVMAGDIPKDSLYAQLLQQRASKTSINFMFHFLNFSSDAANNTWAEETKRFVSGQETVQGFIEQMNLRMTGGK